MLWIYCLKSLICFNTHRTWFYSLLPGLWPIDPLFRKANRSPEINLWWQSSPHFFGFINCKWVMFPQQLETLQANLWPIFCLMVGFGGLWNIQLRELEFLYHFVFYPGSRVFFAPVSTQKVVKLNFRRFLLKCVRRYRLNWYGIRTLMEEKMAIQFSSISCSNVFEVCKSWVIYDPWLFEPLEHRQSLIVFQDLLLFAELPHLERLGNRI